MLMVRLAASSPFVIKLKRFFDDIWLSNATHNNSLMPTSRVQLLFLSYLLHSRPHLLRKLGLLDQIKPLKFGL